MRYSRLFKPYNLNDLKLANRFVMSPMTRSRSSIPGETPNTLISEYYKQRSSAGNKVNSS
ncbi:hypothetical protein [Sphingobacterium faecium]|uniref:oxidoreductase n=1 Tax=Sphingobacterium faecium TaxID=34087 RepID=UPI0032094DCC